MQVRGSYIVRGSYTICDSFSVCDSYVCVCGVVWVYVTLSALLVRPYRQTQETRVQVRGSYIVRDSYTVRDSYLV